MDIKFFDAHTHVQFAAYEKDRELVINRALREGVGMVNVGTQKDTSRRAIEIANEYKTGVWATVGLHPIHTDKSYHDFEELGGNSGFTSRGEELDYEYYKKLALDPKVVAIGECGLDYAVFVREQNERGQKRAPAESAESGENGLLPEEIVRRKEKQKNSFLEQIKLAKDVKKPLMIHCRSAFPDLIEIISTHKDLLNSLPGVVHFFGGTKEEARRLLDLNFYFTFGGVITFPPKAGRYPAYDEIIKLIPLDRILSETDAPYVAPAPYRGTRNEPAYVTYVVKKLSEIKNIPVSKTQDQILENTKCIFSIIF
ncbi:MAG: TatD family hydrolase [Patescibacteria group bacterium]|nr:TatD family hydrolase [Patescibacteria group bacterium]